MDFSDLVAFVDREARIVTNPVFGRIYDIVKPPSGQRSSGGKTALERPENLSFITQVDGRECPPSEMVLRDTSEPSAHDYGEQSLQSREVQAPSNYPVSSRERRQCVYCNSNHALEDCLPLRWKPRIQFLASNKLFFGYLSNQHISRFCPQRKTYKIANCSRKHPSILHTSPRERHTADVGVGTENDADVQVQVRSSMVDIGMGAKSQTIHESGRTAMAVIPVNVGARDTDRSVITYAFLDNGSNSSFCTESLMKQLEINSQQAKISLSTLEKKNSAMESFLVRDLLISDLDENEWISLPTL